MIVYRKKNNNLGKNENNNIDEMELKEILEKVEALESRVAELEDMNSELQSQIDEKADFDLEKLANGIQKWIVEEFASDNNEEIVEEAVEATKEMFIEEMAPKIQKWVVEEYMNKITLEDIHEAFKDFRDAMVATKENN